MNDSDYHFYKKTKKKSFGRKKTRIEESMQERVVGSDINAGGNLTIQAKKFDGALVAGGDSNITVIGSQLNANGLVNLAADGDVVVAAQEYTEYSRKQTIKRGFGGLSNKESVDARSTTKLGSSDLISGGHISVQSGNDIAVLASNLSAEGNVKLDAVAEVNIAAGEVLSQSEKWTKESGLFTGGALYSQSFELEGNESTTAQASTINSGNFVEINAGNVKVVGSDLNASDGVKMIADIGDIGIFAAKEHSTSYSQEEKMSVSLAGLADSILHPEDLVSFENGQATIKLAEANYDKVDSRTETTTNRGSNIVANNDLSLNAASDVTVEGSNLIADANSDQQGSVNLTAGDNVVIKEATNTSQTTTENIHGKAEVSVVVQHQAVEVAKAAVAVKDAHDKLKDSKKEYSQYKKKLASLEETLATLEQEYADHKPGVNADDIEELRDLVDDVKSDEAWYLSGITLAAADVTSKTTQLVQQSAAAAQSAGTYGFNAGLHLDIEASKTNAEQQSTTSLASNVAGNKINIQAGNKEGNQALIQGSDLKADDAISIAANEVNILASEDTATSTSETNSGTISASMTVYGASSGLNLNASLNRSQNKSTQTTHTNSTLNADNISIASTADTNIKGANVDADKQLLVNVGGDLNVESVQDRLKASNKGMGLSAGVSLSGGETTGANGGINASNGRTNNKSTILSTLTSGGDAKIVVAKNTDIKGAMIGALAEDGTDSGKLSLTTDSLTFTDLSNTNYNQNQSIGLNTSVGVNADGIDATNSSTSVQYVNKSKFGKTKNLATLGNGDITINNTEDSDDITALNRDVNNTVKELFSVDRTQGNVDVTLDHRLLTEEGRSGIKEDIKRTELGGKSLADVALEDSVELTDTFEHMDVVQKELDVELLIAKNKGEAALSINNLDTATAKQKQDAINDYAKAYSNIYGVSIESALVIAVDKAVGGAHYEGKDGSKIVLNDEALKNAQSYMNTLAHEVTHALEKQKIIGDKGKQGENYAKLIGKYAEGNYEFALENAGLLTDKVEIKIGDVNKHIGNDSEAVVKASEQFKYVQQSGTKIDYYMTQSEAQRKAELKDFLFSCTNAACRNSDEFKSKQKELVSLNRKDEERDSEYKSACYLGGDECNSESAKVVAAHQTWDKETLVKDSALFSEFRDISSKNAEAQSRPWELAAGSALMEMPTDALIDTINVVPALAELSTTAYAATQGDAKAQQKLKAMYQTAVKTMSDPNGAADRYIADITAKEASGEISSFEAKKQISKFYISVTAAVTGSVHGITKLGSTSLDGLEKAGSSVKDMVSRVEVKVEPGTLGSTGGNIKVRLKPKTNVTKTEITLGDGNKHVSYTAAGEVPKVSTPPQLTQNKGLLDYAGNVDDLKVNQHAVIDLSAHNGKASEIRKELSFANKNDEIIYLLKDTSNAEILKAGESSVKNLPNSRLSQYVKSGRRTDRKLELEVITFEGKTASSKINKAVESSIRNMLKADGHKLSWDHEGLNGTGPGVPGASIPKKIRAPLNGEGPQNWNYNTEKIESTPDGKPVFIIKDGQPLTKVNFERNLFYA